MTAYFYCCPMQLDVGSVVHPGNWEQILRTYSHRKFSNTWLTLVSELVHEHVRREAFPMKPSRFHCLFLCTSATGLSTFRIASGRLRDIGYEVELLDPAAQSHLGDWTLSNIRPTDSVVAVTRNAILYWRGISIANPELATLSPIRIARRLRPRARWRRRSPTSR
jgi:hypothetical protein